MQMVDHDIADRPRPSDMKRLSAPLSRTLTLELDGAQRWLRVTTQEILLAALGRTFARTRGDGVVVVDAAGTARSVPLTCVSAQQATATEMLGAVRRALQDFDAPADVRFSYLDSNATARIRKTPPGLGHALELRVYRSPGVLHMDWWYDTRRFDPYTVEELTEQFPLALIELTSEAVPPADEDTDVAVAGQALVNF
jgi:hypothetical protein